MPNQGLTVNLNLLNAFMDEGLEEGNPRLQTTGGTGIFLARPILPRRFEVSMRYDFGSQGEPQAPR
jgi:hypothetical protein